MNVDRPLDYMSRSALGNASQAFMSNASVDEYNTPLSASPEFWENLPEAVQSVRVLAGGVELFADDIKAYAEKLKVCCQFHYSLFEATLTQSPRRSTTEAR